MNLELIRDFKIELTGEVKINTAVVVKLRASITATASQVTQYITNNKLYSENLTEVREQILAFSTEVYNIENKLKIDDINVVLDEYFNPSSNNKDEIVLDEEKDESVEEEVSDEIKEPELPVDDSTEGEAPDDISEPELPADDPTTEGTESEVIEMPETIGDESITDDEEALVEETEGDEEEDGISI